MRVRVPPAPRQYNLDFPLLTGGLNTRDLEYRLKENESPYMKNLWWDDGVLQSRDGQEYISDSTSGTAGIDSYDRLFHGYAFFNIDSHIFYGDPTKKPMTLTNLDPLLTVGGRGTFFQYFDHLYYKDVGPSGGIFVQIEHDPDGETPFKTKKPEYFVPTIQLNTDPVTAGGSLYQPENRLSPKKSVEYTAKEGIKEYHLPVAPVDSVDEAFVDGVKIDPSKYKVDLEKGTVTFDTAPPVHKPEIPDTVKITYSKLNRDAERAIMSCKYATVAGSGQNLCIMMAGCEAQPNAVFWNANDHLSMNPFYWPITNYNLVGDTNEAVTGFGRQYSDTIVLKEHSVGKLDFGIERVDNRDSISFTYTNINNRVGCDLPWSIQLIENNLVFANTYQGVQVLRSSSAAYENNVECISDKINDRPTTGGDIPGLLADLRAEKAFRVTSFDDDKRYWLVANDHAYVWDYEISKAADPSWFYFTNIGIRSFFRDDYHKAYGLNGNGRVVKFGRTFTDFGEAIDKVYQFPVSNFGVFDRLKNVTDVLLSVRGDTNAEVEIEYKTDLEIRKDLTDIFTRVYSFNGVDLAGVILGIYNRLAPRFATVVRRRPMCRHVKFFTLTLRNNKPGQDLSIMSAQVLYHFTGRER